MALPLRNHREGDKLPPDAANLAAQMQDQA
jgi:hypothetical protein